MMKNLERIFHEALILHGVAREEYLAHACGEAGVSRDEVETLLKAHEGAGTFLTQPSPAADDAWLGRRIGVYELVRGLGHGGSGRVFLGRRTAGDFEQHVAVKILRRALNADEQARRFRVECEALSRLEHPNIARLLDAGTTDDARAYLVMELVEGETLLEHCNRERMRVGSRLRLFRSVCHAVQYAHTNLVVHRDLKPGNILVNGDGQVKLLDFGIAKLLDPGDAAETSTLERRLTPRYASPEQLTGRVVTTSSDVFSLGVLLYQLVTGQLPYAPDESTTEAWSRALTAGNAARPSEALGDEDSALRQETTKGLRRRIRGDLDRILLKAVHTDPDQRYDSPLRLAEDLERFLAGKPVMARPDTVGYRLSKFLRRNKAATALAGLALVSLVAATVVSSTMVLKLRQEQQRTDVQRRTAEATVGFLRNLLGSADPVQTQSRDDLTVRQLMATARTRVADELADQPLVAATLQQTIAEAFKNLDRYGTADSVQTQAIAILSAELGPDATETLMATYELAKIKLLQSDLEEAERIMLTALDRLESSAADQRAVVSAGLAELLARRGDHGAAFDHGQRAVTLAREGSAEEVQLQVLTQVGLAYVRSGHATESMDLLQEAIALSERLRGPLHTFTALTINNYSYALQAAGRSDESEPYLRKVLAIYEEALGPDSYRTAVARVNLANTLGSAGNYEEAEALHLAAVATLSATMGEKAPYTGHAIQNLGAMYMVKGDHEKAVAAFLGAIAIYEVAFGEEHPNVGTAVYNMARSYRKAGQHEEALAAAERSLAIRRAALGEDHPDMARAAELMGRLMGDEERYQEAEPWFRRSYDIRREAYAADNDLRIQSEWDLGNCLRELSRLEEAEPLLMSAQASLTEKHGPDHDKTKACAEDLAELRAARQN